MPDQAEVEFRDAISSRLQQRCRARSAGACCWRRRAMSADARAEAQTSVRLKPNVDGLLVLARLDLKQNQVISAENEVQIRRWRLSRRNPAALRLKRDIAAQANGFKIDSAHHQVPHLSCSSGRRPHVANSHSSVLHSPRSDGLRAAASPPRSSRFASTTPSSRSAPNTSSAPSNTRARPMPMRC